MFLPDMSLSTLDTVLLHPAPKHHMNQVFSGVMGCVSIAFWIIVFTPQIYECYVRKSSDGLSLAFVVLWLVGDLFNVAGAILQHVLPTMTLLALYYTFADLVLFIECIVYRNNPSPATAEQQPLVDETPQDREARRNKEFRKTVLRYIVYILCVSVFGVVGYLVSAKPASDEPHKDQPLAFWGQVNGWLCAILYLASRVPQIKLNYERKSTDGISLLFFMFAVLGNVTYVLSILAAGISKHDLILNASWLAGSFGTLFLDFVIFFQFTIYRS